MQNDETNIALVIMVMILASSSLSLWQVYKDKLPRQTIIILWGSYILPSIFTAFAAFHSFWPIPVGKTISIIGGGLLCLIGGAVCLTGIIAFNSLKQRNGMETFHVVVTGIYQWTRNPQNLGWGMILLGIALLGKSGLALAASVLFFLMIHFFLVYIEEPYLEKLFGEQYREYCLRTPRYFGHLRLPLSK